MILIILILIIIIIILSTYLFLINKELRSIPSKIEFIKNSHSNQLIHTQYNIKDINTILIEINNLIKEFNNMETQYEIKNQSLRKMITNISHDLRTPLTSAVGYIDIILNNEMNEEEERLKELKIIEERLKKLEELIDSFFEFSKIVSSENKIEIEKINLITVLENSIVGFCDDFSKKNRMIHYDNHYHQIELNSNVMLLTRIFDNLINNAFMHSNGDLYIQVIKDENIQIIFTNELLDDVDVDKMFEEFYTTDISRTNGHTGLGLAIAKEFVLRLGGQIYATKDNGQLSIVVKFMMVE
ncbi:MAG: HAMP domain-containing histidine kinase [Erysipelotrichaceae bacterium]|nr:HAMP domain-containing histidine kinase [Erysipelotrichaceae bacterium]